MRTGDPLRVRNVGVTVVELFDLRPGFHVAVHILDEVEWQSRLSRELARLREGGGAPEQEDLASADHGVPIPLQPSPSTIDAPKGPEPDEIVAGPLSTREREVLRAIASGQAAKEIANTLHISVATARNHVQRILKKLGVHTKLEAIALAFRNGWT